MDKTFTILLVEDNEDDAFLLLRAMDQLNISATASRVKDGQEAINYLEGEAEFEDRKKYPLPELIVLDLKMPRMTGSEFLVWWREKSEFKLLPTIVLSASALAADVKEAYRAGANTYFVKTTSFQLFLDMVRSIYNYWSRSKRPPVEE